MNEKKTVFVDGPITPECIGNTIAKLQTETTVGAHDIFLGQVRADKIDGKTVHAIEYSAYEYMAELQFHTIQENAFEKFEITRMHIYHSMGTVKAGELCLFVLVAAPHRKVVFEALEYVVEMIKKEVPIFGKEIFEDETHQWKTNTLSL